MKPSETHLKGFKSKLIKDYSATKILMFLHFINTFLTFNFDHKPMEAWKANVDTNMMMKIPKDMCHQICDFPPNRFLNKYVMITKQFF